MKYPFCCETMRQAIQDWGGVWWDEEKMSWRMVRSWIDEDNMISKEITHCPWCNKELKTESEE